MMKTVLLICLLTVKAGCITGSGTDRPAVRDAVLRYTHLLSEGYAGLDLTPLQKAATDEQTRKVYHHMSALASAGIRMESHLLEIEFLDIHLPGEGSARVKTRERWNYIHLPTGQGATAQIGQVQDLVYILVYELMKKEGRWLVSSVSVLEENS